MAEIIGALREDATYGEKQVRKLLGQNLPKEYTVYVETPIRKHRDILYPDFIVVTNYGVIVLEVKDWVMIERATPAGANIRTRSGKTLWEVNPVTTARQYAISLSNQLISRLHKNGKGEVIPWGYAVVLINLSVPAITQLRTIWGEEFVFGKSDLDIPDLLLNRLKMIFPCKRMRPLTKIELDQIRATIFPVVEFETTNRPAVILDEQQEKIVAEPVRQESQESVKKVEREEQEQLQAQLFEVQGITEHPKEQLPPHGERISQNVSIRLVRGFSGSGKTLVLIQRARYLAALYPEWKIAVLTYNKPLQEQLEETFKGTAIKPRTFHSLCARFINTPNEKEANLEKWIGEIRFDNPKIRKFSPEFICQEINWLRDIGITDRDEYLSIVRKGIGKDLRLNSEDRHELFTIYEKYRAYLCENNLWDWEEIPLLTLQAIDNRTIKPELFDAVLIDEAQDWAPVWFKIVNRLINPEHGLIFLADDPSQSIYRFFSWKEKAVNVVGRTRWLKIPYRNTYEIYRAAYSIIANHSEIQKSLMDEGEIIEPELSSQTMRHGPIPLVRKCRSAVDEISYIKNTVLSLRQEGFPERQIAILVRYRRDMDNIQREIRGSGAGVYMIHSFKGLEMEAVIIPHLQNTFINSDEEVAERRLIYMAMSRARSRLYLTYTGKLPPAYADLRSQGLADFIE